MLHDSIKCVTLIVSLLLVLLLTASRADETTPSVEAETTLEDWIRLVDGVLPTEVIREKNSDFVAKLLSPVLGDPLSKTFNLEKAIPSLFEQKGLSWERSCFKRMTDAGEISRGDCRIYQGKASGEGSYRELSFSKHMALGNIGYHNRTALKNVTADELIPIRMSDREAYDGAIYFLNTVFGVSLDEMPIPPKGAILPVKTVALGIVNEKGISRSVSVEKIVKLKRGLFVGAGDNLDWVPGPGQAFLVLDDTAVKEVVIRAWQEVVPHPDAHPEYAKSRSELIDEMSRDLFENSNGPTEALNVTFILSAEELRGDGVGLLLPTVRISVSPVPDDLSEEEQGKMFTTAGFVRDYCLVHMMEASEESQENF